MAIIYSYPTVIPTSDDLVLGTDVNGAGQPTKNFTIQSIVDIVQGGATGLGAVLAISSDALQQSATNFVNVQGTGTSTFSTFTDGTMSIVGGVGIGFSSFASTSFTGKLDANSFNQNNVRTLGILTGLQIVNATPNINLIDTTITAPGLDTSLVTEKAVVDYVATNPTSETLAEVLANGNESGGVNSIDMTGAISNVTFIDSIDPANPTSKAQGRATFGTGDDLQIYFDGTNGYIDQTNNSNLIISGAEVKIQNGGLANTEDMIKAVSDGEVILYHNGTDKIQTSSTGVSVNGVIKTSDGANNGPSYSFTSAANTGMYSPATNEIEFVTNGAARLKISSDGINVTGVTESDSFTTDTTLSKTEMTRFVKSTDPSNPVTTPATAGIFAANLQLDTMIPTVLAVKNYADGAAAASTLTYKGDLNAAEPLNLATDTFSIDGGSNINTSTVAVTGNVGSVVVNLDNAVTITGKMQAGTLSDGTFSGTAGIYTGGVSITSTDFIGNLTGDVIGNVSGSAGSLATPGTIQLLAGTGATLGVTSNAVTYTSGNNVELTTTLANTTVTGKTLQGLPTPAAATVVAGDTILQGIGKLQSQINGIANGLQFQGTWNANIDEGGAGAAPNGTPALASGGGEASSGTTDATTANELVDSTKNFTVAPNIVAVNDKVINQADGQTALVTSIANAASGRLGIGADIMLDGEAYIIDKPPFITAGHYYVVDTVGATTAKNATLNGIQDWQVGDWVIASINNVWQKLNNSAVEGSGTENRLTKWAAAASTLVDSGIIDDGTTIKLQNDTELGSASTDAISSVGVHTIDEQLRLKKGLALGVATDGTEYGATGQVLTASTSAGSPPTWTTPTVGEVTSVTGLYGITVGGTAAVPTVAVTADADNLINQATVKAPPVGADTILINDSASTPANVLKKATLTSIKTFTAESWILSDGTNTTTISDNDTAKFVAAGTGIAVAENNGTITITGSENPGTGTALTLPVWEAGGATLGDSMVKQDAATGTTLTISGLEPSVVIDDTTTGKGSLTISRAADVTTYMSSGTSTPGSETYGAHVFSQTDGTTPRAILELENDRQARFYGGVGINTSNNTIDTPLVINTIGGYPGVANFSSGNSTNANEDCRISFLAKGTGSAVITSNTSIDLQKSGSSKLLVSSTGISVTGTLSTTTSASIGTTLTTGGSITVATHGLLSIPASSSNNLTISGTAVDHAGLSFATQAILPVTVSVENNGIVDLGANGNQFKDLYLSGNVIHGGSGTGIKGGTFNKLYTTGNAGVGEVAFTIDRATTGTMVFDVMFTSDTSIACAVAKKYTVVCTYGATAPIYNKILDTGPDTDTSDFTVAFADDTSNTRIKCTITPVFTNTQKIGITIDLGFGQNDATVVMN